MSAKLTAQDRAIKVLVALIKSHQGLLGLVSCNLSCPANLRAADEAITAAGTLLNELRLGEIKVERWVPTTRLWCIECGFDWVGNSDAADEGCPECGGQCSDA